MDATGTAQAVAGLPARPLRADAQRNYDRLLQAAREVLAEQGDIALEAVAKRAELGIGTLYRHFPSRLVLLESVYRADVDALAALAHELIATEPPWNALEGWLQAFSGYAATKRVLFSAIIEAAGRESGVLSYSREVIGQAAAEIVGRAQRAGVARSDVDPSDVTRLVGGCTMMPGTEPGQQARMLRLVLDGLRVG